MASTFEKSVKGGTKIKLAPPKAKYVEHILLATHSGEAGVAEVFRTLQNRLRDSTWTIVFKSLIIVHLMIKDGAKDVTLAYLAASPRSRLALNSFTDVQTQGSNIRHYYDYLLSRTLAFADTKVDYCKVGAMERMKSLSIDKGLLRETGAIQDQIRALLKCDFFSQETENDIALMAFRLITQDLLDLYAAMNQAVMNVLSRYFELSRVDAERAITLYKTFTKQTDAVVGFLSVARSYENVTRLEIPKIKHAPTSLTKSLEEYLNDKDFDINRRQYLAAQQGRKGTKFESKPFSTSESGVRDTPAAGSTNRSEAEQPAQSATANSAPAKGPAPDLIDFFDSIEQQQQPMAQSAPEPFQQQQQPMATGMAPAQTGYPQMGNGFDQSATGSNPFGQYMTPAAPMNAQYTGMGFGGYGPQPPQQFVQANGQYQGLQQQQTGMQQPSMQQMDPQQTAQPIGQPRQLVPQSTNPFRQSVVYPQNAVPTGAQQSTNPFNRMSQMPLNGIPEQQIPQQQTGAQGGFGQQSLNQFASTQPLQAQRTGTNPFSRQQPQQQQAQPTGQAPMPQGLTPMVTGSTNPFRQSMFVNQETGRGWQTGGQGTMGGLEQMETVPVFPRPGQG
ncbi:ANTH-domain-containing protein [Myriangium duriaei CBS 260.36]|uniref:ANTH-domain-containing protein n=1 Tax=Myriangium duriaei CBS 260.36 TaxID=1168546 RepID=A0A9P4J154_9PEZI|nr:ANTH-domain-containing protein [Myriangium duriaei CBS 260.36]